MAQVFAHVPHMWKTWSSPVHCGHLRNKPVDGKMLVECVKGHYFLLAIFCWFLILPWRWSKLLMWLTWCHVICCRLLCWSLWPYSFWLLEFQAPRAVLSSSPSPTHTGAGFVLTPVLASTSPAHWDSLPTLPATLYFLDSLHTCHSPWWFLKKVSFFF